MTSHYALGDVREAYLEEYTREPLPHSLVGQAIRKELEYFNSKVWELSDAKALLNQRDAKTIRKRWVITNKGDCDKPDIRARLVAQEVASYKSDACFASTPPLEAKRLLLSHMATQRRLVDGRAIEASFIDIKKAYFDRNSRGRLHLFLPREMGREKGADAHLNRCVYGTRDAGMIWEETYSQALLDLFQAKFGVPVLFLD